MSRIKIREVDKDVYELSVGNTCNFMYVSGQQLQDLALDIPEFFIDTIEEDKKCSEQLENK